MYNLRKLPAWCMRHRVLYTIRALSSSIMAWLHLIHHGIVCSEDWLRTAHCGPQVSTTGLLPADSTGTLCSVRCSAVTAPVVTSQGLSVTTAAHQR